MISIKNISKQYTKAWVLQSVNLEILDGGPTGLVGPNGAGKTTLFSIICGFLKPTEGRVSIMGHAPGSAPLHGNLAILPQDATLTKGIPILKHLMFFANLQGFSGGDAKRQAEEALAAVNLNDALNKPPEALSHGMQKRVAIAQTLIGQPKLILLDEPTAGLDPNTANDIRSLIKQRSRDCKFVVSSHDFKDIESICEDLIILKKGQVAQYSKISSMVSRENAISFRLEQPAPVGAERQFETLEFVTSVKLSSDRYQLTFFFDIPESEAQLKLLQALQAVNMTFLDMARGESIESHVRTVTQ